MSKLSERVIVLERKIELLMSHKHDKFGGMSANIDLAEWLAEKSYSDGIEKGKKEANENNS